jgi:lysozyme
VKNKRIVIGAIATGLTFVFALLLIWNGIIHLNNPSEKQYPVRGVDVSAYQGDIDWETLSSQGVSFVFIKATEGSTFVDPNFDYNYKQAQKTNQRVGAYHFFSYDSSGETQANNFIQTVEKCESMLPPVIDIEFYGDKEKNIPEQSAVRKQLSILIEMLESKYGMKPIIYATEKSYSLYISGAYEDYDIWIRNVVSAPKLADRRAWTFWQYTDRECLDGYNGKEKYIDMNVFCGTEAEFANYAK